MYKSQWLSRPTSLWLQVCRCEFSTSSVVASKRSALRKPNISTLTKHLKPDGLTGKERRDVLRNQLKTNKPKSARAPYVPVKRRLENVDSTTKPTKSTTSTTSTTGNNVRELSSMLATRQFSDLGLHPRVLEAVQKYLTKSDDTTTTTTSNADDDVKIKPTEIQALSIPTLLSPRHRHVLCAAETGSGKTLAYLLPVIQQLMVDEQKHGVKRRLDHPRGLILVPTRELVSQVVKTCKSLSHTAKFRCIGVERIQRSKIVSQLANGPIDIMVTTPTAMQMLLKQHMVSLADTRYLVMDEADSLFDAGWGEECRKLIDTIQKIHLDRQEKEKMIIVSATLPRSVHTTLDKLFPHLVKITTPSLHRALPNLKQSFVDLQRFQGNRQLALLEVLKKNIKDEKTLVFCNTKKAVELVHQWLETKNVHALSLYKDAPIEREEALARFGDKASGDNVMISTDIASRGIDTTFVDHVILYDFPTSVVDYLHRVGRTARAGQVGKASSLIGRKDRMMADRIRRSIREGTVMT